MPRPRREDYEGSWHHVMNRARHRERIFFGDADAYEFLDLVGETTEKYGVEVHAYSLMPNHYHPCESINCPCLTPLTLL